MDDNVCFRPNADEAGQEAKENCAFILVLVVYPGSEVPYKETPCIMCAAPWGCAVLWGCSVPWEYLEYRGGYLEYRGGVQYRGGYHDKCGGNHEYRGGYLEYRGGYLEYCGDVQYRGGYHDARGDIMSTVGCSVPWWVIMSTMGDIMSTMGCSVPWGVQYRGGIS